MRLRAYQSMILDKPNLETDSDQPASSLMGMMDSNGREHIEYPPNSGRLWHRDNPDSPWIKD